jgi:lysyl-tRNA synthetase class 1
MTINLEQARGSRAWPFQEAERLLQRVEQQPPPKGYVLFETGKVLQVPVMAHDVRHGTITYRDPEGNTVETPVTGGRCKLQWKPDWGMRYGTPESLALFMFHAPQRAKWLYFDVIPKHVDDYLAYVEKLSQQDDTQQYSNPVWHIHNGKAPQHRLPVNFSLLLNLASACNPEHEAVLWGFISRYAPEVSPHNALLLATLVQRAMAYYEHFVKPQKRYRTPTAQERAALEALATRLMSLPTTASAEELQSEVYAIGKAHDFDNLRDWFGALYAVLLGQEHGPRMGSFMALYGVPETVRLIHHAIHRA